VYQENQPSAFLWPFRNPSEVINLPMPTPFEQILEYLIRFDVCTRLCANRECPASYFLPRRRSQKYCSDVCALPAQREFKRRWWQAKGKPWRRRRENKRSRKKRP
jgi:hypothetical protein